MNLRDIANKTLDGFDRKNGRLNEYEGLPGGDYLVMIDRVNNQVTPWNSEQISIRVEVLDGDYAGRKDFVNLSLDETTSTGKPNPVLAQNIKLIAKLAANTGIELQDNDWDDLETLANALAPAEGRTLLMHLKVNENKKNPKYPFKNYDFEETDEIEVANLNEEDLPF